MSLGNTRLLSHWQFEFLNAITHLNKRLCPSVLRSISLSVSWMVPCYFRTTKIAVFEVGKTSATMMMIMSAVVLPVYHSVASSISEFVVQFLHHFVGCHFVFAFLPFNGLALSAYGDGGATYTLSRTAQ